MFEKIKLNSKKLYYSNAFLKYQNNTKKTWAIMKEIIGKSKIHSKTLPKRISVNGNEIYSECEIASHFNKYFVDIGPTLAKNIPPSTNSFTSYLSQTQYCLKNKTFTSAELETAFFSIKKNKAPGYDDISSNVILNSYSELKDVLFDIFNKSLNSGLTCFTDTPC